MFHGMFNQIPRTPAEGSLLGGGGGGGAESPSVIAMSPFILDWNGLLEERSLKYRDGTQLIFPTHIRHIIKATNAEIGGLLFFSKLGDNKLVANSIFLAAGNDTSIDWSKILTSIYHGSYMIFHTHPIRTGDLQRYTYHGYSGIDLYSFFKYQLLFYKKGIRIHYLLSTPTHVHITFIDMQVLKFIRKTMKILKPLFTRRFGDYALYQDSFCFFMYFMFQTVILSMLKSSLDSKYNEVEYFSVLDTISFTGINAEQRIDIYNDETKNINLITLLAEMMPNLDSADFDALQFYTIPERMRLYAHISFFHENYLTACRELLLTTQFSNVPGEIEIFKRTVGLFKTTSFETRDFFNDDHLWAASCKDSAIIYAETIPWDVSAPINNIEELSPRTPAIQAGGAPGKMVPFKYIEGISKPIKSSYRSTSKRRKSSFRRKTSGNK